MKQLLILGFHCKIYQKLPVVRVFANDQFLNEFELPPTQYDEVKNQSILKQVATPKGEKIKEFEYKAFDHPNANVDTDKDLKDISKIKISNPFLAFIEFEDLDKEKLNIKIEIKNSDSNYSNGFMTDSTLIMLNQFWIISKNLIKIIDDIEEDYRYTARNYIFKKSLEDFKKLMLFRNRTSMFKSILDIDNLNVNVIHEAKNKIIEINGLSNNLSMGISEHWFGGNMSIFTNLVKKHGLWVEDGHNTKGPWRLGDIGSTKYLLNKYKQHEN
jgi:hypothetical protein